MEQDVARVNRFTVAMSQVLSQQSSFTYFMHMRAKSICNFENVATVELLGRPAIDMDDVI